MALETERSKDYNWSYHQRTNNYICFVMAAWNFLEFAKLLPPNCVRFHDEDLHRTLSMCVVYAIHV